MSYNANKKVRLKDVKNPVSRLKTVTDDHEQRIEWLEELALSLLELTNAVIRNITREA